MPICAACGFENPEGHRFCGSCGASLTPAVERRKLATSVFCDLSGSTELAGRVDAESVFELMRSYFDEARAALERHGGTVEKFIGDAVVGMFGVLEANEDDALRACRASAEIQERIARLNIDLEQRYGSGIAVRIGINTGEVVAGDAARREMFSTGDAVVLGDSVNVAARLEQAAAPGEILLGEATYRLVRDAVSVEPIEPLVVKGKSEPVPAFRLLEVTAAGPLPRRAGASFVGRDQELALLEGAFDSALAGRCCRLVTVMGEPGLGKSRLAAELLSRIGTRARVVRGACLSYGEGITYWAVAQIVRQLAGIGDEQSLGEARAQLATFLAGARDASAVADQIAQLVGIGAGSTTSEELAWATRRLFEAAAATEPLVVIVDDIHWAERALLELLAALPAGLENAPVFVVCLTRPELLDLDPEWSVTLRLEPLGERAVDELLDGLGAPSALREKLAQVAGGNPLYAEELVAMLVDDGTLRSHEGSLVLTGEVDQIELPASLNSLLGARLDRLDGGTRDALERGAVEGELFHQAAIVELSEEVARSSVDSELGLLARKDLIRLAAASLVAGGVAYRFKHILVREAAYLAMTKKLRASLHERFADWLERFAAERVGEYDEIIGYHLEQAYAYRLELRLVDDETRALGERAAAHLVAAGRRAATRSDSYAAANLLERSLRIGVAEPHERLLVTIQLGEACGSSRRKAEADSILGAAHDEAAARGEGALAARALIHRMWHQTGDPKLQWAEVKPAIQEAITVLGRAGDERELAQAHRLHGLAVSMLDGETFVVEREWERAVVLAEACGDRDVRRAAINTFTSNHLTSGPTPALEAIRRCEELVASAHGDRFLEATISRPLALFHAMTGHPERALELVQHANAVLDELGPSTDLYRTVLAKACELAGDPAGAEREFMRMLSEFRDLRHDALDLRAVNAAFDLADFYFNERRFDEADAMLSFGRSGMTPGDGSHRVTHLTTLEARLAAHHGDHAQARSLIERALPRSEARPDALRSRASTWIAAAEVQLAIGDIEQAEHATVMAIELCERKGNIVAAARIRSGTPTLV